MIDETALGGVAVWLTDPRLFGLFGRWRTASRLSAECERGTCAGRGDAEHLPQRYGRILNRRWALSAGVWSALAIDGQRLGGGDLLLATLIIAVHGKKQPSYCAGLVLRNAAALRQCPLPWCG
jgi:hypothetical protein